MKHNVSYEYTRDNIKVPKCWRSPNNNCQPHFHSSLEFIYIIDGQMSALLDSHPITASKGDIIIVPSYTIHSYTTEDISDTYVLTIPLDLIPSYSTMLDKKTFAAVYIPAEEVDHEICHCLEQLLNYTDELENVKENKNIIKGYSYIFLGLLINQVGLTDISNKKITSLVQNILIYLQDHFRENLTLETLASNYGYSKSRFSHIFNLYFGCSLSDYINGLRCRYALELIQQQDLTITDIALSSGFESVRTFYRAFKKQFGYSPMHSFVQELSEE